MFFLGFIHTIRHIFSTQTRFLFVTATISHFLGQNQERKGVATLLNRQQQSESNKSEPPNLGSPMVTQMKDD